MTRTTCRVEQRDRSRAVGGGRPGRRLLQYLDIADLDGDIENSVQDGRAFVAIDTDSDKLVGKDGEVLDALQELARLVVMTETGHRSPAHGGRRWVSRAPPCELVAMAKDAIAEVAGNGRAGSRATERQCERKIVRQWPPPAS